MSEQHQAVQIAEQLIQEAQSQESRFEKWRAKRLSQLINDPQGMALVVAIADQSFRSKERNPIKALIAKYGAPAFLSPLERLFFPYIATFAISKAMRSVILPGESEKLSAHLIKRKKEGVRINLNRLGEAIIGEQEAKKRLELYLRDLSHPLVECISVKISTLTSQLNHLDEEATLQRLSFPLRRLYRKGKWVNLDMEEYRDLHLTVALFRKVLDEEEFLQTEAGIVLQAYLPDSWQIQQELTKWAKERIARGGAPIRLRIVKGANLAMEKVEASTMGWPQTPYLTKAEVDANYHRMVAYGCQKDNAPAVKLGVASHNLFDLSYALLLREKNGVEKYVHFEMLEGMADPLRRAVQKRAGGMLLYCPAVEKSDFEHAVAYLIRRLDENAGPENFLHHVFNLKVGSSAWENQKNRFLAAFKEPSSSPRRTQDRRQEPDRLPEEAPFANTPDTDWSLPQNQEWARSIVLEKASFDEGSLALSVEGRDQGEGYDPSRPGKVAYRYPLATDGDIDRILTRASPMDHPPLAQVALLFAQNRRELLVAMMADGGKLLMQGDPEVTEAIDFIEYYRRQAAQLQSDTEVAFRPRGTIVVAPPWNFPCSIPTGCIAAALATGNAVIFKPAPEAVMVGSVIAGLFWEAGVSQEALQFVCCHDEPEGSFLIEDRRVNGVMLTGGTATAKAFLRKRPNLHLIAESGGKNTMIISNLADRDLAIDHLVQSAFGHAGQKCSAASLAIIHKEVYDDPKFMRALADAAASWQVGSAWDLDTRLNPLVRPAQGDLLRGLTQLEPGEKWLLKPRQLTDTLWTPGIKLDVRPGGYTHQTELFGPVLGLVRAETFDEAISFANSTPFGLTAGLHSLDDEEINRWLNCMEAGNLYVNRTMTGAIVRRQPFGGMKGSSFGLGYKAGGPHYLQQLLFASQVALPNLQASVSRPIVTLRKRLTDWGLPRDQLKLFERSAGSYAYWYEQFQKEDDPSQVLGERNFTRYRPRKQITFRISGKDHPIDVARVIAAALTCHTPLEVSWNPEAFTLPFSGWEGYAAFIAESEAQLCARAGKISRLRTLTPPSAAIYQAFAHEAVVIDCTPPLASGQYELPHYLQEVSISHAYHRYGHI